MFKNQHKKNFVTKEVGKKLAENLCANLSHIKSNLSETTINVDGVDNAR